MCFLLLQSIDTKWKDHLYAMDVLRSGVGLEGMGGKDPKLEYKRQGFTMFEQMKSDITDEVSQFIFKIQFEAKMAENLKGMGSHTNASHTEFTTSGPMVESQPRQQITTNAPQEPVKPIRRDEKKIGRNDPCSCGSGKKYKKCHGVDVA